MKKYYSAIAIVAGMFMLASCSNDVEETTGAKEKVAMTFGVNAPDGTTRAVISDIAADSPSIHWEQGDEISVFTTESEDGDKFTFSGFIDGSRHNSGKFTGRSYEGVSGYWGMYPAQDNAKLKDGKLSFNIPANQTARVNSFDPKAGIQAGKANTWTTSGTFDFNHACAFFGLELTSDVEYVKVYTTNKDWHLAGDVTAEVASGKVAITSFVSNLTNTVTLSGGELSQAKAGDYFLLAFVPSTTMPPFTVEVKKNGTVYKKEYTKASYEFDAGFIYKIDKKFYN